jgi:hypothetical protein
MTLYTIVPEELVWEELARPQPRTVEVRLGRLLLEVAPTAPGMGTIVRLLQAPLDAYLRPELSPGRMICYAREIAEEVSHGPAHPGFPFANVAGAGPADGRLAGQAEWPS